MNQVTGLSGIKWWSSVDYKIRLTNHLSPVRSMIQKYLKALSEQLLDGKIIPSDIRKQQTNRSHRHRSTESSYSTFLC